MVVFMFCVSEGFVENVVTVFCEALSKTTSTQQGGLAPYGECRSSIKTPSAEPGSDRAHARFSTEPFQRHYQSFVFIVLRVYYSISNLFFVFSCSISRNLIESLKKFDDIFVLLLL